MAGASLLPGPGTGMPGQGLVKIGDFLGMERETEIIQDTKTHSWIFPIQDRWRCYKIARCDEFSLVDEWTGRLEHEKTDKILTGNGQTQPELAPSRLS